MKRGKFIVFEGISGTGKETQANLLQKYLSSRKIQSQIVYHPSPELKDILHLWRKNRNIDHVSEAYFLLADRYNRVTEVIKPALAKGEWVISLRSWVSALVYQAQTQKDREYLTKEFACFEPKPDFLFYFDIDPSAAYERTLKRQKETGEALGKFETIEQLNLMRRNYKEVMTRVPYIHIEAGKSIQHVHSLLKKKMQDGMVQS